MECLEENMFVFYICALYIVLYTQGLMRCINKMKNQNYHTVGTDPTKTTILLEQIQNPIEKW